MKITFSPLPLLCIACILLLSCQRSEETNDESIFTIEPSEIVLHVGEAKKLSVIDNNGRILSNSVTWKSSNETVANVSEDGIVHGISEGTSTIQASYRNHFASCSISVLYTETNSDYTALVVDSFEDTHIEGNYFIMRDGAFFQSYSNYKEQYSLFYYNPSISNTLDEGLLCIIDRDDETISFIRKDEIYIARKIAEKTYNFAIILPNRTRYYHFGICVEEDPFEDSFSIQNSVATKMSWEDRWHISKSAIFKMGSFAITALGTIRPSPLGIPLLFTTAYQEAYKSNLWNLQDKMDKGEFKLLKNFSLFSKC